ncbi:hypothetical protein QWZ13_11680 [Reinekea marina]|uniref:DUF7674 domain-containing protein n=1 Tax=Reinekea marina TaxID=1310421 RepID=A0ABV7WXI4_9GAMM|nr:hypothetical protein [Reinekea marina]MDN3649576.1 hypothetical protein [Reinekea marina]
MNTVEEFYIEFRRRFSEITEKADIEHIRIWDTVSLDTCYCWFESLANTLNSEMESSVPFSNYKELFEFIRKADAIGSKEISDCIDVSFVENLFWKVAPNKASPYWNEMPAKLKAYYQGFHHCDPL